MKPGAPDCFPAAAWEENIGRAAENGILITRREFQNAVFVFLP